MSVTMEKIALFGCRKNEMCNAFKNWWSIASCYYEGWKMHIQPSFSQIHFVYDKNGWRRFKVELLHDDYAELVGKRFDIVINPPESLFSDCCHRLTSTGFISDKSIFDILSFILLRNNEMDCLDYQSMKNSFGDYCTPVIKAVPSNIVAKFSKDEIPTYIACTTDRPLTDCFVTVSDPLKDEFKVKDSSLGMKSNKVIFDEFLNDLSYKTLIKDLLNLEFGKGGIDMDIRNKIEDVIFNGPATIVKWTDGTKTIVKCKEGEIYNPYMGLAMCITKKVLGNKGNFNDVFKKWITPDVINPYMTAPQEGK